MGRITLPGGTGGGSAGASDAIGATWATVDLTNAAVGSAAAKTWAIDSDAPAGVAANSDGHSLDLPLVMPDGVTGVAVELLSGDTPADVAFVAAGPSTGTAGGSAKPRLNKTKSGSAYAEFHLGKGSASLQWTTGFTSNWRVRVSAWTGGKGAKGDAGKSVAINELQVAVATSAGVDEGAAATFKSLDHNWICAAEPTSTAPRIKLTLPAGRTLGSVFDPVDGEISDRFDRVGATQVWLANEDFDEVARTLLVLTT